MGILWLLLCLAGCGANQEGENGNAVQSANNGQAGKMESSIQSVQDSNEPYTADTKISDVINDDVFGDYGRLIFPVDSGYYSGNTLGELKLTWYNNIDADKTVEIANYLKSRAASGQTVFYDIYTDEEKAADPIKRIRDCFSLREILAKDLRLQSGGRWICLCWSNAGQLSACARIVEKGYNAFALIYRPGAQTACEDLARAISFILSTRPSLK